MNAALVLAGEHFAFEGLQPEQLRSLETRYGPRLTAAADPAALQILIRHAPASEFPEIDTRGWEYTADIRWSARGFTLTGLHVKAIVDVTGRTATIVTCAITEDAFWGVVENVLRPLLAVVLLERGGLLVHSAAVDGLLFAGRSGAGKSTIAALGVGAGLPVLSDDLNALVPDSAFRLLPLPFTGDLTEDQLSTESVALRAVVALEHSGTEAVRDMSTAEAASLLVRCAPYVNLDPNRLPLLLDRAAEIASSVPLAVLSFRREGNPWPILRML